MHTRASDLSFFFANFFISVRSLFFVEPTLEMARVLPLPTFDFGQELKEFGVTIVIDKNAQDATKLTQEVKRTACDRDGWHIVMAGSPTIAQSWHKLMPRAEILPCYGQIKVTEATASHRIVDLRDSGSDELKLTLVIDGCDPAFLLAIKYNLMWLAREAQRLKVTIFITATEITHVDKMREICDMMIIGKLSNPSSLSFISDNAPELYTKAQQHNQGLVLQTKPTQRLFYCPRLLPESAPPPPQLEVKGQPVLIAKSLEDAAHIFHCSVVAITQRRAEAIATFNRELIAAQELLTQEFRRLSCNSQEDQEGDNILGHLS